MNRSLAADEPRKKQCLFCGWIERPRHGHLPVWGSNRSCKADTDQFFEPILCPEDCVCIFLIETVPGIAGIVHHDLVAIASAPDFSSLFSKQLSCREPARGSQPAPKTASARGCIFEKRCGAVRLTFFEKLEGRLDGADTPRGPAMYLGTRLRLEEAHVRATKAEQTKQYMAKRVTVRPIGPKFA
jgi:hypothetical protein